MSRNSGIVRGVFATIVFASCAMLVSSVNAQDKAVSKINGKVSVEGGEFASDGIGIVTGTVTTPIGNSFGFQVDGDIGVLDGETIGGGAFHFFTRDPSRYLFGVYGSYHQWNSIEISRIGGEMELYRGRFSFTGIAGFEKVNVPRTFNGLNVVERDDDHFFTELDLHWYPKDNLRISGGYHYENEENIASASLEYMPQWKATPATLFAKFDAGDNSHTRVTGGLRFYLNGGEQKSLIRRQREDDPFVYRPTFTPVTTVANNLTGTNFCPAENDDVLGFALEGNEGCTCPSGTPLAGGEPIIINGYAYRTISYTDGYESEKKMPTRATCFNITE